MTCVPSILVHREMNAILFYVWLSPAFPNLTWLKYRLLFTL
jgi:hypothetical protein